MSSSGEPKVLLAFDGAIAVVTLNRPEKLNALDPEMLTLLEDAFGRIEGDSGCRAVVLKAANERAFSVGADLNAWSALEPIEMWRRWVREGHRVIGLLAGLRQPTIAAIDGMAFGGGLELALACDLRIASSRAVFAMPEVTIATVPGWGGTGRLPGLIGPARAKQMILTGERIDATTASAWALVNEVSADCESRAREIAARIASNAPVAVQVSKELLNAASAAAPPLAALEALAGTASAATQDAKEGIAAFRERRAPRFLGR